MAEFDESDSASRVSEDWDVICYASSPLCGLLERVRYPGFGISPRGTGIGDVGNGTA